VVQAVQPATAACVQPEVGLQVSRVHALASSQASGVPAAHRPAWQVSDPLHMLPSVQDAPSATLRC
jgi:hypothetical protein